MSLHKFCKFIKVSKVSPLSFSNSFQQALKLLDERLNLFLLSLKEGRKFLPELFKIYFLLKASLPFVIF